MYSATLRSDDLLLQVGSCVALTGNLGYNAHQNSHAEKRGMVYEMNGRYIPAVQAEFSFSLVLVKSFTDLAWHLAWQVCALVTPHMSYLKRASNPPGYTLDH